MNEAEVCAHGSPTSPVLNHVPCRLGGPESMFFRSQRLPKEETLDDHTPHLPPCCASFDSL